MDGTNGIKSSFVTKASKQPLKVVSNAPRVVGKLLEHVSPVTNAFPDVSTLIPRPLDWPPRKVE